MVGRLPVLVLFAMALPMEPVYSQDKKAPPKQALSAELEVARKSIPQGTVPTFKLKITNGGKEPQKVLKLRGDLQDTYFDLEVSQDGKRVSVPRAISDPGTVADSDYVTLKPGESVTYELKRFASAWERLPVGKYAAVVRVWPPGDREKSFLSPEAMFEISK
jgi:hypothetical protein